MQTLSISQVRQRFSELLNEVERKGSTVAITRRGRTIALLAPVAYKDQTALAIESIRKNCQGVELGKDLFIKALSSQGRK
jgi:prevent-host-death family protein